MNLDRRLFLKGLAAAAVAISVPLGTLEAVVKACDKNDIQIFYVRPELYMRFEKAIPPWTKFMITSLADKGIDHLCYKGIPVVPFTGRIDTSVDFIHSHYSYKLLHEKFVYTIERFEKEYEDRIKNAPEEERYPEENYDN